MKLYMYYIMGNMLRIKLYSVSEYTGKQNGEEGKRNVK